MGYNHTNLAAANAAVDDYFLNSVDMKVGAYTLDETAPTTQGARHVSVTHTSGDTTDDPLGTVTIVGVDLSGQTITEVITVEADDVVESTSWFVSIASATGAGWVIDGSEGTEDAIEIGYGADICVLDGGGVLHALVVNTTAAATVVAADSGGTIATLAASIAVGTYEYDVDVSNLTLTLNGASDITIVHTPSIPKTYALT